MGTYQAPLIQRNLVAEGTMAFVFAKPTGFRFEAGEYIDVFLIDPPETDAEGDSRSFSIASAPHEPHLMVATRLRDTAFKRVIQTLPLGTQVRIEGPSGSIVLQEDTIRPAVFLAGGIGITPFRSILFDAANEHRPHQLMLFYSNRRPEDAPFLNELTELQKNNPHYRLIATMTDLAHSQEQWTGETGYIDAAMLKRYLRDLKQPIYYIVGPPAMTKALQELLHDLGISRDNIRLETFTGY